MGTTSNIKAMLFDAAEKMQNMDYAAALADVKTSLTVCAAQLTKAGFVPKHQRRYVDSRARGRAPDRSLCSIRRNGRLPAKSSVAHPTQVMHPSLSQSVTHSLTHSLRASTSSKRRKKAGSAPQSELIADLDGLGNSMHVTDKNVEKLFRCVAMCVGMGVRMHAVNSTI